MPRYFFNVKDGELSLDKDGVELPTIEAARAEAVVAAGAMLHEHGAEFWKDRDWRMWVEDERGSTVCALRLVGE